MGSPVRPEEEGAAEAEKWSDEAIVYVNGVRRVLPDGLAHLTLLQYLRDIGLQGTKLGCGEGGCGACTVMVSSYDQTSMKSQHFSINACMAPLYSMEGMHIITVEGIGDCKRGLHQVQEFLAKAHGSQCGFCTPGFAMSMYALLRSSKEPPTEDQIEDNLSGNLCRCTGYRPIIDAFRVFAKTDDLVYTNSSSKDNGQVICPSTGKPCSCRDLTDANFSESSVPLSEERYSSCSYNEIDGNAYSERELIFPPELQLRKMMPLKLNGFNGIRWYRPLNLKQVLRLKAVYPDAKIIVGNTEVGVETKFKNAQYKVMISVTHVPELNILMVKEDGIQIGSAIRLAQLQNILQKVTAERDLHQTSSCQAIIRQLKWFAGTQIRNVASVGGNICTASPISDLNPLWMAAGAKFQIIDVNTNVRTTQAKDFFLGYRKGDIKPDEILLSVIIPWTRPFEFVKEFKQAHRRADDIALVNSGMRVYLRGVEKNWIISDVSIVYGGVAVVPFSASKTENFLTGKKWDSVLLDEAFDLLKEDIPLSQNAPGGMVGFRRSLALSFFFKFFLSVTHALKREGFLEEGLQATHLSATRSYCRAVTVGSQCYELIRQGTAVGQPMVHMSAMLQITGEAEYTDDTTTPPNTLHAALVLSKKAHARILSIDDSLAKSSPGFAGLFLSKDVPGDNHIEPFIRDEEIFASDVVTCVGQIIGIVVADTHDNAKNAANKVQIEYSEFPAILSIEEAIKTGSFHPNTKRCLAKGNVEQCFLSVACDQIISGEVRVGGQEHFYMEPQCALIWPVDSGNEMHMVASTQILAFKEQSLDAEKVVVEPALSWHFSINACMAPLYSMEGMHIITVEGIGDCKRGLHQVQEFLAKAHGSQCGFCTPGFAMSMYALLRSSKEPPTEDQIEDNLSGNLCRCTGYRPIIDAFRVFAKTDDLVYTNSSSKDNGQVICPSTGKPCSCRDLTDANFSESSVPLSEERYSSCSYNEIDGNAYSERELIFPPELQLRKMMPLKLNGFNGIRWYRPLNLKQVLRLKAVYPDAKIIVGNTEVGVETKFKNAQYKVMISVTHVPELNILMVKEDGIQIGSAIRLAQLQNILQKVTAERDLHQTSSCQAIIRQLKWFAGTQIRNVASVGGNICTASPISDLNPLWMAAGAKFQIIDVNTNVRTTQAKDFFLGYRKGDIKPDEILLSVIIPWTRPFEFVKEFKQAHRRADDIALVNSGMRVYLRGVEKNWIISDVSIVYGGVAVVPFSASKTENFLTGKKWDSVLLDEAFDLLKEDIPLSQNAPGGMVGFRRSLALSFFFKFFLSVTHALKREGFLEEGLQATHLSATRSYCRAVTVGSQCYELIRQGTAVGQPMVHMSAMLQITGEAEYTDDTTTPPNTLHAALVLSKKAHARILSIDDSLAKSSPGFAGLFLSKDVPGDNHIEPFIRDEEIFASDVVTCVGQIIGIVVADTHDNAKNAANKVQIEYSEFPAILSIEEAIKTGSFHPNTKRCLAKGNVEQCFLSVACDQIISGEVRVGGQEHFYMEPQCALIWPVDSGNEMHMVASTQAPYNHQKCVANVLGLPLSKVVCRTKRIGGGFGGKETRSALFAAAASVPSYCLRRPVKIVLDRDVDMAITGQRHSFLGKYKVGFTNDGKILALDLEIYSNGGNTLDQSLAVLQRAMFHSDNVYDISNIRVSGQVCLTNIPSNTAFRGFGAPQGMLIAENWIHHMATELKRSPEEIKAGALVQVYTDGTVLVTHGGVEMGQGLHTKVAQVAASSFNIPLSSVFISETSTDKVPNASATAASASSDIYGAAVLDACQRIKARMEPIASRGTHNSFAELVQACYMERVDLSAHGFYATPDIDFDWAAGKGTPYHYFTYGAAFAEVEIDTLTGDFHTRIVDIVMDLGFSINPAIDIGQIEGAFIQGLGWIALEELKWGDEHHKWIRPGHLFTCGPGSYKIPSVNDVPLNFKVSLLKGTPNPKAIHSSKAVGEPPFFLGSSVLFAIKDAIFAARAEEGHFGWFPLDNPATPERIRMACVDFITKKFASVYYRPKLSV